VISCCGHLRGVHHRPAAVPFGLKKPQTYWVLLVRVLPPEAFTIPVHHVNKVCILNTKLPVMLAAF
jgi:hypothetical protein